MELKRGLLLDANYNGRLNKVQLQFYDLDKDKIVRWTDDTHYLPYCLAKYIAKEESSALDRNWAYKGHEVVKRTNLLTGKEEEYTDKTRRNIRNYIREVNKLTHGNYAYDDRMVMGRENIIKETTHHCFIVTAVRNYG